MYWESLMKFCSMASSSKLTRLFLIYKMFYITKCIFPIIISWYSK